MASTLERAVRGNEQVPFGLPFKMCNSTSTIQSWLIPVSRKSEESMTASSRDSRNLIHQFGKTQEPLRREKRVFQ